MRKIVCISMFAALMLFGQMKGAFAQNQFFSKGAGWSWISCPSDDYFWFSDCYFRFDAVSGSSFYVRIIGIDDFYSITWTIVHFDGNVIEVNFVQFRA